MPPRSTILLAERLPSARIFLHQAGWSLIDQGVVSLGTFLVSIVLARHLASSDYGVFALLLASALSLQLVNTWLVAYPLGLRLATAKSEERARLKTTSIALVAFICVPLAPVVAIILIALDRADLIIPAIVWFVFWQIQQATRRALLADLHHRAAVLGDTVSNLGQAVAVGAIAVGGFLSLPTALYGMAVTMMLGAVLQTVQLRPVLQGLYGPLGWFAEHASLGCWSLATGLVAVLRGHLLLWPLAIVSGTAMVASLQAALNVFFLLNPIQLGLINLIPQVAARAYNGGSKWAAWRAARPYVLLALPPTLIYLAFTLMYSPLVLKLFYGHGSPYLELGNLFPSLAVFTAAMIVTELIICYFLGIRETKLALKINLVGVTVIAIVAAPLFATFGPLAGSCLALAVGDTARLAVALFSLRRLIGSEKRLLPT